MACGIIGGQMAAQQALAAKRAQELQQEIYSSSDEPRHIAMGGISRVLDAHGDRLGDMLSVVSLFLDRFFGPQLKDSDTTGVPVPQPSGMLPEVERHLSRNNHLIEELSQKIRRLDDIA